MLRLTEILLFLTPFGFFILWLVAGRQLAALAWPALAVALIVGGMLIGYGVYRSMPAGATYVPAHVESGRIVDGHAR